MEYRKAELDTICSLVKSDMLDALLEDDTLLDMNVIYYYFDVLRSECPDAYLADPNICISHIDTHRTSLIVKFRCCIMNVYLFIIFVSRAVGRESKRLGMMQCFAQTNLECGMQRSVEHSFTSYMRTITSLC